MVKTSVAWVFAAIIAILVVFAIQIGKDAEQKEKDIKYQIWLVIIMNFVYMLSLFTDNYALLCVSHTIVQVCEVWILMMFLRFCCYYAEIEVWDPIPVQNFMILVSALDSLMLLGNLVKQNFYTYEFIERTGYSIVHVNPSGWFYAHLVWCYIIEVFVILAIVNKAVTVSKLYRGRHIFFAGVFIFGAVFCLVSRIINGFMVYPAVVIMSIGEGLFFAIYYYAPHQTTISMTNFVVDNLTSPVVMFDDEDRVHVYNQAAKRLLKVNKGMTIRQYVENDDLAHILTPERRAQGKTKEFTLSIKISGSTYLIHGQELHDETEKYVGTLLLYNDITSQERLKDEATFHATRDSLTGLWNREYFFEAVTRTLSENPNVNFVLIVSDLYQFKIFNEILGKKTGDDLLLSIASNYAGRRKELWEMGRIGGDKFALIMPEDDFDEERFIAFCNSVFEKRGYSLKVHYYLGVYHITERNLRAETMYDRAYMAVESVKGSMQKIVAYYEEEIRYRRLYETMTVDELETAINEDQFAIYLQPQIDTETLQVVGAEALVRWNHPKRGMIPPSEFIPIFEDNGMITKLDLYVWELACRTLAKWKEEGKTERTLSVNISAKDFYLSDLYENISSVVKKYDLSPKNLRLEITETAIVLDVREQAELVKRLQADGFLVEMDDFGSGYSSLNSLKDISVDILKLDMRFFESTLNIERAKSIVESMVSLSHRLGMPVIAEGVDSEEQVEMLRRSGCHVVQGFYYARPMPLDKFEEYVQKHTYVKNDDWLKC